jgi:hypothetical protein
LEDAFFIGGFLFPLQGYFWVDRFELIATTGKNAKMLLNFLLQSPFLSAI